MGKLKLVKMGSNGFPDIYRGSEKRRFGNKSTVDQILVLNSLFKNLKHQQESFKWKFTILSKSISTIKPKNCDFLSILFSCFKKRNYITIKKLENLKVFQASTLSTLGNLIHNTCMLTQTEFKLRVLNSFNFSGKGKKNLFFNHFDILKKIKAVDYKRGVTVAGNRGFFLKNTGVLLNFSIIRYGLDFLSKKKYICLQTPYFMKNSLLEKCTQLNDFSEQLYTVGNNNKFLIATSEQPISAFHFLEQIPYFKLPLRYSGFSTCFRKEGGSHGKDTSGIFRVHQFEKVEQFVIGKSDVNSWKLFEEMLENSRNFYFSLNIPICLINIPSGSINLTASKKIDILGFFPASNTFRELVSCSNCTTHQSKKLCTEFKMNHGTKEKVPVAMLNSTLCASTRLICCICENYQNKKGINIPLALRSYTGISFLPFYS